MNPEVKAKWVAALRSREYWQGQRRLRQLDDSYCCLGVACDLYAKEHHTAGWSETAAFGWVFNALPNQNITSLIDEVFEWTGIDYEQQEELINLNDNGKSFKEIADYIEANL